MKIGKKQTTQQDAASETQIRRIAQYRDRWSAYEGDTGIISLSEKLAPAGLKPFSIFRDYDDAFLETISPDISVAVWKKGAVLFEEGAYIDLAFFVARGKVALYLQQGGGSVGDDTQAFFDPSRTMVLSTPSPRASSLPSLAPTVKSPRTDKITFLSTMDFDLQKGEKKTLVEGDIFGEIGALSGWPQSVTACTDTECTLVQIRLPALRAMKRKSPDLKNWIDRLYRQRSLGSQLNNLPIFQNCSGPFLETLKEAVDLVSLDPRQTVVEEGKPVDAFYVVRSGFLKLTQKAGGQEMAVSYLSKGMSLGELELLLQGLGVWEVTASSVGYSELIKIPRDVFLNMARLYPDIEEQLWQTAATRIKEVGLAKRDVRVAELTQTVLETGLVQGTSMMVIDLNVCTRCDNCVRACAATHGGRPRFIREGNKYANVLIPKSCYHCMDPVCLVGCPTGAIHRAGVGHAVEINPAICIGCSSCANSCPYDAIVMHDTGQVWPDNMVPAMLRGADRRVASKCDLCYDSPHGPACVRNCPQGCLSRVDSTDLFSALLPELERAPDKKKPASPKPTPISTPVLWKRGFLAAAGVSLGVDLVGQIFFEVTPGNIWGLSLGIAALVCLLATFGLPLQRKAVRFSRTLNLGRAVSGRYLHLYGGSLFLLLMLLHSGFRLPRANAAGWAWGLGLWTALSGGLGLVLQKWIPKTLVGLPLEVLHDRIPELITEIRSRAEKIVGTCGESVQRLYKQNIAPLLMKPQPRLIYWIDVMSNPFLKGLKGLDYLKVFLPPDEKERVDELIGLCRASRQINVHYTLQKGLRYWLYLHIPASLLLLFFVLLHLCAVFFY